MAENEPKKPQVDPSRALSVPLSAANVPATPKEKHKVTPLEGVEAKRLKTPLSKRLRQAFTNDDARSVGDYLLFDVAVPAIRDLIFNMIQGGASRAIYGQGAPARQAQQRGSQINYNRISAPNAGTSAQPVQNVRDRGTFNFENIIFPTRQGAELALTAMMETIEQYQVIAVSDLMELVNLRGSWSDDKWGWFNLQGADIVPVRTGFVLELPPVQPIH